LSLIFVNFLTSIPDYISLAVEKNSTIAYLTICLAMFLENIIPPIPSEIIMPLGGFFVYQQKLNFYFLVFWGLLGTILGSLPWYYLGRLVNEKRISNFLEKMHEINAKEKNFQISVRHSFPIERRELKYIGTCQNCGEKFFYRKRIKNIACKKCCVNFFNGSWNKKCLILFD